MKMNKDAKQITVKDIMSKSVISVDASMTINEAAKMMDQRNIGCIIVTKDNSPIGIVTERDFVKRVAANETPLSLSIDKVMSSPLIAIGPDESVWMISDLMYSRKVRKLPVIDNEQVIGIVTATDLVNQLAVSTQEDIQKMFHESVIKVYKQYSPYN